MLHFFKNINHQPTAIPDISDNTWINVVPPLIREDFVRLSQKLDIPLDFFTDSLDIDERARFEKDDLSKLIVIKVPVQDQKSPHYTTLSDHTYITIPICIILTHNHIITINSFNNATITRFLSTIKAFHLEDRNKMVLDIFKTVVSAFLSSLKEINQKRNELENQLYSSGTNEVLMQLMTIQKSLVYLVTALRSNELLMMKLDNSDFLQLKEEHREELKDIIVDISQAHEMANIYTTILNGTLSTFAGLISNNQNQVLKKLTLITIVLQFPVLISSIYGMNVPIPYQDSPYAFYIPVLLSILLSFFIGIIFIRKKI